MFETLNFRCLYSALELKDKAIKFYLEVFVYLHLDGLEDNRELDKAAFKFSHNLKNHPSLSIESLSSALPRISKNDVMYSKGLSDLGANFDRAHLDHKNNLSLEETIERLRESQSYIMVRSPEQDSSFEELYRELRRDVSQLCLRSGCSGELYEPKLYLFIASPGAFTPFHIDRYSTLLFQIRGSKEVATFPQFDERIVKKDVRESFADYGLKRPEWNDELDVYAQKHQFSAGEALHIPFIAGHYVKNGMEDISISMSIIFRSNKSQTLLDAMAFNHRMSPKLAKIGIRTTSAGLNPQVDRLKAGMLAPLDLLQRIKGKISSVEA